MSGDVTDGVNVVTSGRFEDSLSQAKQSFEQGEIGAALSACRKTLDEWPDIRRLRAILLDGLKEASLEQKGELLDLLMRTNMRNAEQDADLADALFKARRFEEALPLLRNVVRVLGGERFSAWNYVCCLEILGHHDELIDSADVLDEMAAHQNGRISLYNQLANARLAKSHDEQVILREARVLEASSLWLRPEEIVARLTKAIKEGTSFSLVNFGYLEARVVCATSLHASCILRPTEMIEMADSVWPRICSASFEDCSALTLSRLGKGYRAAAREASVLCVPPSHVLQLDHQHIGFFAEQNHELRAGLSESCAPMDVMGEIASGDPGLCGLLTGLPFAGIVTDIPGLAERIATRCKLVAVTEIMVEHHALDTMLTQIDQLWVPYPGAVFLVVLTGLAPYACGQIAAKGGVAIDVGSCAGTWDA
ncbi:hypothetical protein [Acetobacter sp.]|uniref:hypothetical protein n=1 Tax=Acetobacter sp. TaxID=440 RepID=UPI0039EAB846